MLDKIIDYKKLEMEHVRRKIPLRDLKLKAQDAETPRPFLGRFDDGINVIAEVKKASPSAGVIREDFNPVDIATVYAENGAKAISVLTDERFFQGHLDNLVRIKAHLSKVLREPPPLLRKDFTIDEYHVYEARSAGADAILLIVAALDSYQLKDYRDLAEELGLGVLIEVHDKSEADRALAVGVTILGINNRDLKTFRTDVQTTKDVITHFEESLKYVLPVVAGKTAANSLGRPRVISESGLKDRQTLLDLKRAGADGFLIGESLMREKDFGQKLREFVMGE